MPHDKIFVPQSNAVAISCPGCGNNRLVSVAKFQGKKNRIRIKCSCAETFEVELDFRKDFRKSVSLEGSFKILGLRKDFSRSTAGVVMIKNISRGGVGFEVRGMHSIELGDTLELQFLLDDSKRTKIVKEVVVVSVNGDNIGSRYANREYIEKGLGFYLMSHD